MTGETMTLLISFILVFGAFSLLFYFAFKRDIKQGREREEFYRKIRACYHANRYYLTHDLVVTIDESQSITLELGEPVVWSEEDRAWTTVYNGEQIPLTNSVTESKTDGAARLLVANIITWESV